jgi:hypothetical protein
MAVQEVILATNPAGPVEYNEKAVNKILIDNYLIADTKKDGVQLNLVVDCVLTGHPMFLSRAGKFLPALQRAEGIAMIGWHKLLKDDMCIYPNGFMLQAEIVTPGFPAEVTAGNLRRKSKSLDLSTIEVHVFGVVPLDVIESGEDHNVTHAVMKYHVEAMVGLLHKHVPQIAWKTIESIDVFTQEELKAVYEARREAGEEGLVVKDPNAIWRRGKKVGQWKMKPEDTIDGRVVGIVWGTPGLANEGKVIGFEVELEDGHVVNACGLRQGHKDAFTWKVREACHPMGLDYRNPFEGWICEVAFMERFKDGSLRHPTFNRWRGISDPTVKE